jgi:uncharacterized protein YutE (UPF0331/DUF86 family)
MEHEVVLKKIESLIHCINRLEKKRPQTISILNSDYDIQDIISINLERAIQISIDIAAMIIAQKNLPTPSSMEGTFVILEKNGILKPELSLKMQKSVGFRNISVHEYEKIDWEIVFDILVNHLGNFKNFTKAVLAVL